MDYGSTKPTAAAFTGSGNILGRTARTELTSTGSSHKHTPHFQQGYGTREWAPHPSSSQKSSKPEGTLLLVPIELLTSRTIANTT